MSRASCWVRWRRGRRSRAFAADGSTLESVTQSLAVLPIEPLQPTRRCRRRSARRGTTQAQFIARVHTIAAALGNPPSRGAVWRRHLLRLSAVGRYPMDLFEFRRRGIVVAQRSCYRRPTPSGGLSIPQHRPRLLFCGRRGIAAIGPQVGPGWSRTGQSFRGH
jgi:hypothetical protein